jgi:S-adenosylmethionine:tRNA-ribosyltransferase-isomerase (queuine synthetase)
MKIDFISSGALDAPLIRLFTAKKDEIEELQSMLLKLINNETNEINISELPISESKIKLIFKTNKSDLSIKSNKDKNEFKLELSKDKYFEIKEKLDPFLTNQNGFTWLNDTGSISLLFTTDGKW